MSIKPRTLLIAVALYWALLLPSAALTIYLIIR
jgi:hypothetical protein